MPRKEANNPQFINRLLPTETKFDQVGHKYIKINTSSLDCCFLQGDHNLKNKHIWAVSLTWSSSLLLWELSLSAVAFVLCTSFDGDQTVLCVVYVVVVVDYCGNLHSFQFYFYCLARYLQQLSSITEPKPIPIRNIILNVMQLGGIWFSFLENL